LNLTSTPAGIERYRGEPYVYCGDVYSNPQHLGRAGWSWYTGSSGWLYQAGLHEILGINVRENRLTVTPCIPKDWPGFEVRMRCGKGELHIHVHNPKNVESGVHSFKIDGIEATERSVPFPQEAKTVRVDVLMG
jgi:cyclic beta-1,2-glucan synthetase